MHRRLAHLLGMQLQGALSPLALDYSKLYSRIGNLVPGQCTAASALSALQFMTATKVAHPLTAACKCESVQSESINAPLLAHLAHACSN